MKQIEKINSYSYWIDCCFEKFENILKGGLIDSSKSFNDIKDNVIILFEVVKIQKVEILSLQRQIKDQQCFYQIVQCAIVKKSNFIKKQNTSDLELKTSFSQTPLLRDIWLQGFNALSKT